MTTPSHSPDRIWAGAPEYEIEITPEMIEAGLDRFYDLPEPYELSPAVRNCTRGFEVDLAMIRAGVALYMSFDPEKDEPEALIAEVLFTAKEIWEGKRTDRVPPK